MKLKTLKELKLKTEDIIAFSSHNDEWLSYPRTRQEGIKHVKDGLNKIKGKACIISIKEGEYPVWKNLKPLKFPDESIIGMIDSFIRFFNITEGELK